MNKQSKIFVAGHKGMVGAAVLRHLQSEGYTHLITRPRTELDLSRQSDVERFFNTERPEVVILAAARVGGILANREFMADFTRDNLQIALNVIEAARNSGVTRLLNLGSTCIYPRQAPQPMPEECLLTGPLESTNEGYAIAKIAALKLCQYYRRQYGLCYHSAMPTNLYGPGDNYHSTNSHVLPALIRRIHEAKILNQPTVELWGTGTPQREFLYVDDLARAIEHLLLLENPPDWVNVGVGQDLSIAELAVRIAKAIGYQGSFTFDTSKPDGTPRKLVDVSRLFNTGWHPTIDLDTGIRLAYQDFLRASGSGSIRADL